MDYIEQMTGTKEQETNKSNAKKDNQTFLFLLLCSTSLLSISRERKKKATNRIAQNFHIFLIHIPFHSTTDRSDPGRFFGDGAIFKAKLIGILEVGEARGDRMCQEALQVRNFTRFFCRCLA